MAENNPHTGLQNPAAHEEHDLDFRWIVGFGVGLIVAAVVIFLMLWGVFDYYAARSARALLPPPPLAGEQSKLPPEPRLQGVPGHPAQPMDDLEQLRAAEDAVLNQYGWVDQPAGIVRIPIDRAMQLLAERGLPTRPQDPDQTAEDPGAIGRPEVSSAGRTLEKKPQ